MEYLASKPRKKPRQTMARQLVWNTLLALRGEEVYGFEIIRITGMKSGSVYPILARLEQEGLVQSSWEQADPSEIRRPCRRYYQITDVGSS